MYTNTNRYSADPSNLRFIAEMDSHEGFWLVFDTKNQNRVVGVHNSATLAALDATKREQDRH
jgi:hypothetical protein